MQTHYGTYPDNQTFLMLTFLIIQQVLFFQKNLTCTSNKDKKGKAARLKKNYNEVNVPPTRFLCT